MEGLHPAQVVPAAVAAALAPLLLGFIQKTKAFFAGRAGAPLAQPYRDLVKLLGKGAVYSRTTTWVFRAGPPASFAAILACVLLVPIAGRRAAIALEGDFVLLACLLGLARFLTALAALDTGSSFEGMGASREVQVAALVEPALFLGLAALARETGSLSLSDIFAAVTPETWIRNAPMMALVAATLLVVFLAENARIPVDDPATHLELTMIHEVMVLDHGGPDLALVEGAAALKTLVLGALLAGVLVPLGGDAPLLDAALWSAGLLGVAILTGIVESSMARLRLVRVPQMLVGAAALSAVAFVLALR